MKNKEWLDVGYSIETHYKDGEIIDIIKYKDEIVYIEPNYNIVGAWAVTEKDRSDSDEYYENILKAYLREQKLKEILK